MCELFGLSCNSYDRAIRSLPIFSNRGSWCKDGWGMGYYKGSKAVIQKHPEESLGSQTFKNAVEGAKSNIVIAHVRAATQGDVCEENCHPFKFNYLERDWIFAHNGSIPITYESKIGGDSDSAMAFSFMIDHVADYLHRGAIHGLYPGILEATKSVFDTFGKNITFNYILADGQLLYVLSHYAGKNFYFLQRRKSYGGAFLVSTIKLTDENWQVIPRDRLLVIGNGEIIVLSDKM